MEIKKLSKLNKWYLKYTDRNAYSAYKKQLNDNLLPDISKLDDEFGLEASKINHPALLSMHKEEVSFVHSGNAGDIIYSLPAVYELSGTGKANLYLQLNQPATYDHFHPLGNVMLTQKMADMLSPLLLYQSKIKGCLIYQNEQIDYDLDRFRDYNFILDRGSISRWYFHMYGINAPLHKPWLIAPKDELYKNYIVVCRSHRYRAPLIDYSFLREYADILFLGVREEFDDMKKMIPHIKWKKVNDFLEMAIIINSAKLFIGNQSFPFSVAEGLKVKRLLEIYYRTPNVIPEGDGANDFMYQPQFEYSVKRLLSEG